LFVNPGGPGGSGIDFAFAAASLFSPELLQRFDIIGVDPRGVARSHPVVCSAGALSRPGDTPPLTAVATPARCTTTSTRCRSPAISMRFAPPSATRR
jgi:hypothetical protein